MQIHTYVFNPYDYLLQKVDTKTIEDIMFIDC